ncbi:MAG TPA: UDP-glucose 4-epimerase GalE [Deltaproteobacteria bacterium]|nr:UDP-glucose 4-epimerase GalE [Deltaproteobacteria bacterium]
MNQRTPIVVTGGAGYIGSHTCKALAAAGFEPVSFDSLVNGHRELVRWGPFEAGDLLDPRSIRAVLERYAPAAVVHFAAFAYVGQSVREPAAYYRNNVAGTLNLLDAMVAAGTARIVFSSTCAVYGEPERMPITEDVMARPVNPYGRTKLAVEGMLADFGAAYGIESVCLRYFNAAGADPEAETGEDHRPETHLVPLVLDAAAGRRPSVTVNGTDYATPDGTCIRDFIHVSDLAGAHVLAVEHLLAGGGSEVVNLGSGRGASVREVIETARAVTGREIRVETGPRRPGDPPVLIGSWRKAERVLRWRPLRSDMETIIADAWRWHRKRFA